MPNIKITVAFDSEKLAAIDQFAPEGMPTVEAQLLEHIEKIYTKIVPQAVKQYIERNPKPPEKVKPVKAKIESKTGEKEAISDI